MTPFLRGPLPFVVFFVSVIGGVTSGIVVAIALMVVKPWWAGYLIFFGPLWGLAAGVIIGTLSALLLLVGRHAPMGVQGLLIAFATGAGSWLWWIVLFQGLAEWAPWPWVVAGVELAILGGLLMARTLWRRRVTVPTAP